jgi:hypothetical protein
MAINSMRSMRRSKKMLAELRGAVEQQPSASRKNPAADGIKTQTSPRLERTSIKARSLRCSTRRILHAYST